MKKLILRWLFGTDEVKEYIQLLLEHLQLHEKYKEMIDIDLKMFNRCKEELDTLLKLVEICEKHGIDIDKEL